MNDGVIPSDNRPAAKPQARRVKRRGHPGIRGAFIRAGAWQPVARRVSHRRGASHQIPT